MIPTTTQLLMAVAVLVTVAILEYVTARRNRRRAGV